MTTPCRAEIRQKAQELYAKYQDQCGASELAQNTCEENELKEDGFWSAAVSELMQGENKEWTRYPDALVRPVKPQRLEIETENFDEIFDVDALLRSGLVVFGGSGCGKSTLAKAVVRRLAAKGIVSYVVDSSRAWTNEGYDTIEVSRDCKCYIWNSENTVFDVCLLSVDEKVIFADTLARSLLDAHICGTVDRPEILVFEESETYLGNNTLRSKRLEHVLTLVSTGRNFALRYIAISQVPSMIDKLPIKLCEQRFFGRLSEPNDQRYCKAILNKESVEQLKSLTVGNFISENKGKIQKFKLETEKPRGWTQLNFTYQYAVL
jgi:energy-coupling factor transporter ATP-binding protein EcfA2